jgi:hypothetical protein
MASRLRLSATRAVCALLAATLWVTNAPAQTSAQPPVLHIAYFVPSDRQPIADRVERLDRVMTEVQQFYLDGMVQNGYEPMTFQLDRNSDGSLRVFLVKGRHPMRDYGRNDSGKVRQEVKDALAREGIAMDRETARPSRLAPMSAVAASTAGRPGYMTTSGSTRA